MTNQPPIYQRGRSTEKLITIDFLSKLNESLENCISEVSNSVNIISINSDELDFVNDESVKKSLANQIQKILL